MNSETNNTIAISLPQELVSELTNYADCYAPFLRQVAQACVDASKNLPLLEEDNSISELDPNDFVKRLRILGEVAETSEGGLIVGSNGDFKKAADEIERLRALITAWVDADGAPSPIYNAARSALRKAVGR